MILDIIGQLVLLKDYGLFLYEIIIDYLITGMSSYADYWDGVIWPVYGKYDPLGTIRFIEWNSQSRYLADFTEDTRWVCMYYPRHYPYKNIASGEKPYELGFVWEDGNTHRMWTLYKRL